MACNGDLFVTSLVYAMDYRGDLDDSDSIRTWEKTVLNILDANDFDAIPLVSDYGAYPSRIARRRYHDGIPLTYSSSGSKRLTYSPWMAAS